LPISPLENEFKSFFKINFNYLSILVSFCLSDFFSKKNKKRLDMPHGGIVGSVYPVECFLKYQDASPPQGGSYPHEPPFLGLNCHAGLHILTNLLT
jgi:hypothetical protein